MTIADIRPVYLVSGDDPTLVSEALTNLVRELTDSDPSIAEPVADESSGAAIVDAAQTAPFLGRRVLVVRDVGGRSEADLAALIDYLGDPNPTSVLVLAEGGGRTPAALTAAVNSAGEVIDVSAPRRGRERERWLNERVRASAVSLEPAALRRLADHLGDEISRAPTLLERLEAAYGTGARVTPEQLEPYLGDEGGAAPWELLDAVDAGNAALALSELRRQLHGGGVHPFVIHGTLRGHFQAMLRLDGAAVSDAKSAATLLRVAEFRARKALGQARKLGSAAIARAIRLLADSDLDLRGARDWPAEVVLEVLVARLARLATSR